jgi:hypothetical protein
MLSSTAFGQTEKDEIRRTFETYFKAVQEKDNRTTLDYIYPKLFDMYPRERMLESMDRMKEDTTTIINFGRGSITSISDKLEVEGIHYALVKYAFRMTMVMNGSSDEAGTDGEDFNSAEATYEMLKETYGDKNVTFDPENRKLDIQVANEMYAIKDPAYKDWKFLEKKENMMPILQKLLPRDVLKKL